MKPSARNCYPPILTQREKPAELLTSGAVSIKTRLNQPKLSDERIIICGKSECGERNERAVRQMTSPVSTAARVVAELRFRLETEFELVPGDEALETTLEGATDLPEMLAAMVRDAAAYEGQAEAIDTRIKAMQARSARLKSTAKNLIAQSSWAMQEAGMKRIPADALPEMTATLSDGRIPLIIPNDDEVPKEFCRVKYEPNKVAIRQEIEHAGGKSWAYFGNAQPTLTIRTR